MPNSATDALEINDPGIVIDFLGGNCPVQGEGTIDGHEFYFRARGNRWSLGIGGFPVGNPDWYYEEKYGADHFAAGWMTEAEAKNFILKGVALFRSRPAGATQA